MKTFVAGMSKVWFYLLCYFLIYLRTVQKDKPVYYSAVPGIEEIAMEKKVVVVQYQKILFFRDHQSIPLSLKAK